MGSEEIWDRIKDETSCNPLSERPQPCENGCGFFGRAATMNLCSKCYKEFCIKQEQSKSAKAAMENSLNPTPSTSTQQQASAILSSVAMDSSVILSSSSKASGVTAISTGSADTGCGAVGVVDQPSSSAKRKVCGSCKKRLGLLGFECRCGSMFCGVHRYPEEHACSFDFKAVGRQALSKANPVVKSDKVQRF